MGTNVNSVAGRPPSPPSNFMVGTHRPKSAPATVDAWTDESPDAAAVVETASAAVVVVETAAASVAVMGASNDSQSFVHQHNAGNVPVAVGAPPHTTTAAVVEAEAAPVEAAAVAAPASETAASPAGAAPVLPAAS